MGKQLVTDPLLYFCMIYRRRATLIRGGLYRETDAMSTNNVNVGYVVSIVVNSVSLCNSAESFNEY